MIRVYKRPEAPETLESKGYQDDAVKKALLADQHDKCYLCERKMTTDYQVEHVVSQHGDSAKTNLWSNLFVACNYCNDRKKNNYDDIPLPDSMDFEDIIQQNCDLSAKKMVFRSDATNGQIDKLVSLLDKLYNGKNQSIGRNLMEQRFWNQFFSEYNGFLRRLHLYVSEPNDIHYQLVVDDLHIDSPILGVKYSYIKKNDYLYRIFQHAMKWNRDD